MRQNAAERRAVGSVLDQVSALLDMSVGELAERYREVFGEPTHSRNRGYLLKTVAWGIQERADGGLSRGALERIAELGDELPRRWRQRLSTNGVSPARAKASSTRDARLPPAGSVLKRQFGEKVYLVRVLADGFEYDGRTYPTLSRVAREIAGTPWNGFSFFGLQPKGTSTGRSKGSR